MPRFATALRAEIQSASAAQLSRSLLPLRRIDRNLRTLVALLKRRRPGAGLAGSGRGPGRPPGRRLPASETMKPAQVRALRRRFAMNRPQFGRLAGVSTWTVFMWEHGQVQPGALSVARLRKIAKLSPRAAAAASAAKRRRG
jgi:DNA-binding XRE family transcriptional regulator